MTNFKSDERFRSGAGQKIKSILKSELVLISNPPVPKANNPPKVAKVAKIVKAVEESEEDKLKRMIADAVFEERQKNQLKLDQKDKELEDLKLKSTKCRNSIIEILNSVEFLRSVEFLL